MTIFTAGYEGCSLEGFLTNLRAHGVQMLADVREAPISRKPGFSKSSLAQALQHAGIGYRHIRALGCPKPIRDAYKEDGDWARYTQGFMRHLAQQQTSVEELAQLCAEGPTVLLCYEADFNRCHRTYVARAVATLMSDKVRHITAAGIIED